MSDKYYTASQAQAKLGLSKAMFFRKVNQGFIPKVVLPGMKQGGYPRRDIDALALAMNTVFEQDSRIVFSRSSPADQLEEMQIGIRCFGRDFITPLAERIAFQQKSEFTFHSLKVDGSVAGYISAFRFEDDFLDDLLTGRRIEREITASRVLPFVRLEPFSLYIDVIAVDSDLPPRQRNLYAGLIVLRFIDLLFNLLNNDYQVTHIYTVTTTMEGDKLVRKLGWREMVGKSIAPGRIAYEYVLDPAGLETLQKKYNRRRLRNTTPGS